MLPALVAIASSLALADAASLGFDRNIYPGDAILHTLRKTLSYTGYWLNAPPGSQTTSWKGKRSLLKTNGFGFLMLFNGRLYRDLHGNGVSAKNLGTSDGGLAADLAIKEGFPKNAIIFLDQEEGGRLLPEQLYYLLAWVDAIVDHGFRAGVYCSAIPVLETPGTSINTANNIREHSGNREIHFFVYNDSCPPSPGCAFLHVPPDPELSGISFADVWQIAQSPRRHDFTSQCVSTYLTQNLCLTPGTSLDIDLSTARSPDPSRGR